MMRALTIALLVLGLSSCAEHEPVAPASFPSTGLYTPGSTLGASDPTDVPMVVRSNRCVSLPPVPGAVDGGVVGTAGALTIAYTTQTVDAFFAPKNCSAVWIETMTGAYVATIEVRCALRRPGLVYWQERGCTDPDGLGPDVTTSATLKTHETTHEIEWTGLDFEGKGVPDGMYKLHIEITETDKEPGELNVVDIVKGPSPYTEPLPVPLDGYLKEGSVTWTVR
jgi:hypothetical protein